MVGSEHPGIAPRVAVALLVAGVTSLATAGPAGAADATVVSESFENGSGLPAGWNLVEYTAGASRVAIATGAAAAGSHFLQIVSDRPNHARVLIPVPVLADTTYALRASVKAGGAAPQQTAAVLGIEEVFAVTESVRDDTQWHPLELLFRTGGKTSVVLELSLGYFGSVNAGTASFDAVTVTPLAATPAGATVTDLGGPKAGGPDGAARAAVDAGPDLRRPSGALWPVLAVLLIGGAAVAAYLARHGDER